jgi:diaminopimelate epimerase
VTVSFAKYHGLGNDFLVVDLRSVSAADRELVQQPEVARALCDRQFGVGGDGVLAILAPTGTSAGCDARMRVLNADGSEAEMCGNGIRCVVLYLHGRDAVLAGKGRLVLETGAGPLACTINSSVDGADPTVTVDMGRPRLSRGELPMTGPAAEHAREVTLPGVAFDGTFTGVSMGNPHAITFLEEPTTKAGVGLRELATSIGPSIEHHASFPRRTNVELAHMRSPTELELVVWERGCGITLACGTGACATVVAACLTGRCRPGDEVLVHLLGGDLAITVAEDLSTVWMRGPATFVFDATVDPAAVARHARPS